MGKIININDNWKFHYGDTTEADYMGYNDDAWQNVTLPHDWSVSFPFDKSNASGTGYLPAGTAWYRKHFILPDDIDGKRVRLNFDGVYKHSRVFINSHHIGGRASGYSPFSFDISEFVRPGENVISVRVEHEQVADSRWFTGSGIYRDVTLEITEMNCFAENGIFVTTKEIKNSDAVISVEYNTIDCDETEIIIETTDGRKNKLLYFYDKYGRIKSVEDVKTGIKLLRGVPLGDTLFGSILSKRVKKEPKNVRPHLALIPKKMYVPIWLSSLSAVYKSF